MASLRNSLIRLLRTPVKTALFLLLLAFTVALVSAGGSLRELCRANMERFEDIFVTIGTVEQRPERTVQEGVWSANMKEYRYYDTPVYGDRIPLSVLDMEGVEYLSGPEQRAYYSSVASEYELLEPLEGMWFMMIVEASPVEDCVPSERVKMEMKNMLFAPYRVSMPTFYFCDHYEAHPQKLYKDKTYVMALDYNYAHDWVQSEDNGFYALEMVPLGGPYSAQTDPDGNRLPNAMSGAGVEEVTSGFWESERGKAWLALCEEYRLYYESLPVTATEDLNLIMAFYAKEAYVTEGEVFSEEDYQQGNRVCLVSERFANRNKLKVGDSVHLALRYANYAASAYSGGLLWGVNVEGESYPVFEEADYQIKGIYASVAGGYRGRDYLVDDRNEIFIPTASIKNSNENNIAAYGPMKGYTTAFRIPNGRESIENFKAKWEAQNVGYVDISFYDGGFCELEEGLQSMEKMSVLLLATGAVSAVCIVIFFCHLFITKQKKRTAIERSLGMKKRQCALSLLTGILVIALAGSSAGAFAGQLFARRAAKQMLQTQEYDTRYSNGALQTESENREEVAYLTELDARVTAAAGGLVFLFTVAAALTGIYRNLRQEPLALLAAADHDA